MPKSRDLLVKEMKRSRDKAAKESYDQATARAQRSESAKERASQKSNTITTGGVRLDDKHGNPNQNRSAAPLPRKWSAKYDADDDDDDDDDEDEDGDEDEDDAADEDGKKEDEEEEDWVMCGNSSHAASDEDDDEEDDGDASHKNHEGKHDDPESSRSIKSKKGAAVSTSDSPSLKPASKTKPRSSVSGPASASSHARGHAHGHKRKGSGSGSDPEDSSPDAPASLIRPLPPQKQQPPRWSAGQDVIIEGLPADIPRSGSAVVTVIMPVHALAPSDSRVAVAQQTGGKTVSASVKVEYSEIHLPQGRRSAPVAAKKPFAVYLEECEIEEVTSTAAARAAKPSSGASAAAKGSGRGSVSSADAHHKAVAAVASLKKADKDRIRREALRQWEDLPVEELARLHALAAVDRVRFFVQTEQHHALAGKGK